MTCHWSKKCQTLLAGSNVEQISHYAVFLNYAQIHKNDKVYSFLKTNKLAQNIETT